MNEQQTINVLKGLIIDGVSQANSGHPGGGMSSIDFAYVLFNEFLNFDPNDPDWLGRDRFVLSAGHESMMLYALLHMNGWLDMDELKRFRQLHSKTPGHPENTLTKGVECTTGPLGQGAAMSVGFAITARHLRSQFGKDLFSNKTYALLGDGCMQEDITLGAASLAGHLRLDNIVWYYDKNRIQISGQIDRSTSDDEAKIFEGFGWNVVTIDGHDRDAIRAALNASSTQSAPTLIVGNTTIANGAATMAGSAKTHGAPLPPDERSATKDKLGLPQEEFFCPSEAVDSYRQNFGKKKAAAQSWRDALSEKQKANEFQLKWAQRFGQVKPETLPKTDWGDKSAVATRNAFGEVLANWAEALPSLMGGSADLEPSNMTGAFAKIVGDFQANSPEGRNLAFGVREFPMAAIANGMALHGGAIPFTATFLSFADYSRAALRLGALQKVRVIHEFTHDSFYLGEDGPTHQAVEQVMSLRVIPDFYVMRPADALETEIMMRCALDLEYPSAICLSRQKLPLLQVSEDVLSQASRGAYTLHAGKDPEFILFATGSEVSLALDTAAQLGNERCAVVSMPCWELFAAQDQSYKTQVLRPDIKKRISLEAGVTLGWQSITGDGGLNIGLDRFGDSAPAGELAKEYGFTPEQVCSRIEQHFQ